MQQIGSKIYTARHKKTTIEPLQKLFTFGKEAKKKMKIVHLSDLHIFDISVETWANFFNKRIIGGLNYLLFRRKHHRLSPLFALLADLEKIKPDHVVITGDISNLGLRSEFLLAKQLIEKIPLPFNQVTLIPGNHDNYVGGCLNNFCTLFTDYLQSSPPFANKSNLFPIVKIIQNTAVIGLSSAVVTPFFSSQGLIGNNQLTDLKKILQQLSSYFRVVLIHHPPISQWGEWRKKLNDKNIFIDIIKELGCELILHGHNHKDQIRTIQGPLKKQIPVIGVGSASYLGSPKKCARYNIYHIEKNKLVQIETRAFDPKQKNCYTFAQQIFT